MGRRIINWHHKVLKRKGRITVLEVQFDCYEPWPSNHWTSLFRQAKCYKIGSKNISYVRIALMMANRYQKELNAGRL